MRRLQVHHFQVVAALVVTALAIATAVILFKLVGAASRTSDSTDELLRRSEQNQACIVALALHLADPNRDRDVPPFLPQSCEASVAAEKAQND